MAESLQNMLIQFDADSYAVRVVEGLTAILPFVEEFPFTGNVEESIKKAEPVHWERVLVKVQELQTERGPQAVLKTADLLDKGDRGIALYSGAKAAYKLVKKDVAEAVETDPQQAADAGLKAVGIAWMAWKLYPGKLDERMKALWASPAGQAMLAYYAAIELALPFADNIASSGGAWVGDFIESQAQENAVRLAAAGANPEEAMGFLRAWKDRLTDWTGRAATQVQPIAEMVAAKAPKLMKGADAVTGAAATALDTLNVYEYLASRMVLEACMGSAIEQVRAEVAAEAAAAREAEEARVAKGAVKKDYKLEEGLEAASLGSKGIVTTRNNSTDPTKKPGCFGCLLPVMLMTLLAAILGACEIVPSYVESSDVDNAIAQKRYKVACKGLAMKDDDVRRHTAQRLSQIKEETTTQCICAELDDGNGGWDASVAEGIKGADREEIVSCFAQLVARDDLPRRTEAVVALSFMPAPSARKTLSEIATSQAPPELRSQAVKALAGSTEYKDTLVGILTGNDDAQVRAGAAEGLATIKDKSVTKLLVDKATSDSEGIVRAAALVAARESGAPESDSMACKAMMEDESAEVRRQAVLSFKGTKRDGPVKCLHDRAFALEEDAGVRDALLDVLKSSPHKGAADILCDAIPFWMKSYVVTDIPDKLPGTMIVKAQNDRDFERSYECVEKAYRQSSGMSCFARLHLALWYREYGGSAYAPNCPGYENPSVGG